DRRIKPRLRCADAEHAQRATHQRQHDRVDTDRTRSEHDHRVANLYVAALDCVKRRWQRATAGHEGLWFRIERDTTRSRVDVDMSGPSAAQPVIETVSDAVNFALRAARAGFGDEAIPTRITRAMHVEERDAIIFVESSAFNVEQLAANLLQASDRDVSGNKRVRHTREPAL